MSRKQLTSNIRSVARKAGVPAKNLTRALYLSTAQRLDLSVIRSKGTISQLGGFVKARKAA